MITLNRDAAKKVLEVVDCGLTQGMGAPQPGQMCVEAAVCYALGLPHGDDPPCVGSLVRKYKIGLNDGCGLSNSDRAKVLRRIAIAQLGSNEIDQGQFLKLLLEKIVRRVLPLILRNIGENELALACENTGTLESVENAYITVSNNHRAVWTVVDALSYTIDAFRELNAGGWHSVPSYLVSAIKAVNYHIRNNMMVYQLAADIGVEVLQELKSPGCEWLDVCEPVNKESDEVPKP